MIFARKEMEPFPLKVYFELRVGRCWKHILVRKIFAINGRVYRELLH